MFVLRHFFRYLLLSIVAASLVIGLNNCSRQATQETTSVPNMPNPEETSPQEAENVNYMTQLGLMKGHLMVGKELLEQGKPDQAEPHIGHPVEEIYADVEDQLQARGVAEFKDTLIRLHELVQLKPDDPQIEEEYNAVIAAIDQAIAVVPAEQQQSPEFILQVINNLLDTASAEYTAAISNDKIVEVIEYQDSRGFVDYAHNLYQTIEPELNQDNAQVQQQIKTAFEELETAWPTAVAPEVPVLSAEQVAAVVEEIQQSSQSVIKASAL